MTTTSVGILAYGSLLTDAGREIEPHIVGRVQCQTPFKVEFARKSSKRHDAPTLVPCEDGLRVDAEVLVVDLDLSEATNRLYRREKHEVGATTVYRRPRTPTGNSILIDSLSGFAGVDTVIFTRIGANIDSPSPLGLALLAIGSAKKLNDGRDGITYLRDATRAGVSTVLSSEYQLAILRLTGATDLDEALAKVAASRAVSAGPPPGVNSISHKIGLAEDYLLAAKVLASQRGPEADIRLLLPTNQMVAHAAEMALKAMIELSNFEPPHEHDLTTLGQLAMALGREISSGWDFAIRFLGPLHAGHAFRYGDSGLPIPTAMQMINRIDPEITALRRELSLRSG